MVVVVVVVVVVAAAAAASAVAVTVTVDVDVAAGNESQQLTTGWRATTAACVSCWWFSVGRVQHLREKTCDFYAKKEQVVRGENAVRGTGTQKTVTSHIKMRSVFSLLLLHPVREGL